MKIKTIVLLIVLSAVGVLAFIPVLTYLYFAQDLVSKDTIMNKNNTGVILEDKTGKPFFKFYQAHLSVFTPISQISPQLVKSVLAAEDKDFYNHPGFSIKAIAGALVADIKRERLDYGGSTITQQLVKNSLLNSRKNFFRKYQEIVLSEEIERRFSKNEILEMYLNSAYFGEGAFGIEDAAKVYFNKDAKDLDLAQSSLLASLLTAPTMLSPISGNYDKAKLRQSFVLDQMVDEGFATKAESDQAKLKQLTFAKIQPFNFQAPHFALMVRQELIDKYGEEEIARSGFTVKTSLDLNIQNIAEAEVKKQVENLKPNRVTNGAAVVLDPKTGEILALVGSKDWSDDKFGKVDIALSLRQPGSAFKPIVYSAALEDEIITPASILNDSPTTFPDNGDYNSYSFKHGQNLYKPKDYDGKFRGPVLVRRALANSLNVPAVEVLSKLGISRAIEMGQRLGLTTLKDPSNYGLSLVLGAAEVKPIELASVYSVFANGGKQNPPTSILEIDDKQNRQIYKYNPSPKQILDPKVAFQISSILSDNNVRAEEFGNTLNISRVAAVKTGTTENYRDAWTLGYTPSLVVGAWVGNNNGELMDQVAGSLGPAPIWKNIMERVLANSPIEKFTPPDGMTSTPVCKFNGLKTQSVATSSAYMEYFLPGTSPTKNCVIPAPSTSPLPSSSPSENNPPPPPTQPTPSTVIIIPQPNQGGPMIDTPKKSVSSQKEKIKN